MPQDEVPWLLKIKAHYPTAFVLLLVRPPLSQLSASILRPSSHLCPVASQWILALVLLFFHNPWLCLNSLHVPSLKFKQQTKCIYYKGGLNSLSDSLVLSVSSQMSAMSISRIRQAILPSCWQRSLPWRPRRTWGLLKSCSAKAMSMLKPARLV